MPMDLLNHPEIAAVMFHPRAEYGQVHEDIRTRTVRFKLPEGVVIGGRLHSAAVDAPIVLLFHGNGEIASDYDDLAPVYRQLGLSLLVADYRGYGISSGQPSADTLIGDALAVWREAPAVVAAAGLEPSRWLLMGRSLGSAAALAVAAESTDGPKLSGLIIESGFAETLALISRLGGSLPPGAVEARDGFDSLGRIAKVTAPTLIIHGEEDWIIPFKDGRKLFDASGAADKRLLPIRGAGHNDLMMVGAREYFPAIAELAKR
ncbi:MAG: alpha/beta hydrolase [Rhodospirillaceae bacterium]